MTLNNSSPTCTNDAADLLGQSECCAPIKIQPRSTAPPHRKMASATAETRDNNSTHVEETEDALVGSDPRGRQDTAEVPPQKEKTFAVGDHVFCWSSYEGEPVAYQQHGIVMERDGVDGNLVIINFDYEAEHEELTKEEDNAETGPSRTTTTSTTTTQTAAIRDSIPQSNQLSATPEKNTVISEDEKDIENTILSEEFVESTNSTESPSQVLVEEEDKQVDSPEENHEAKEIESSSLSEMESLPEQRFKFWTSWKKEANKTKGSFGETRKPHVSASDTPEQSQETQPQEKQPLHQSIANFFKRKENSNNGNSSITKDDNMNSTNNPSASLFASVPKRPCSLTLQTISSKEAHEKWDHVQYGQEWKIRLVSRAGTCSPLQPDPLPVVLMRIHFLLQHPDLLSAITYHPRKSNGECVASWCKAGQYRSFQGTAKIGMPGLHAGTFGMAAEYGVIAGGQVAAGLLFPPAIPFMAVYDLYDVYYYGNVGHKMHHADKEWKEQTQLWNEAFSKYLQENNDTVEMIQDKLLRTSDNREEETEGDKEEVLPIVEKEAAKEESAGASC